MTPSWTVHWVTRPTLCSSASGDADKDTTPSARAAATSSAPNRSPDVRRRSHRPTATGTATAVPWTMALAVRWLPVPPAVTPTATRQASRPAASRQASVPVRRDGPAVAALMGATRHVGGSRQGGPDLGGLLRGQDQVVGGGAEALVEPPGDGGHRAVLRRDEDDRLVAFDRLSHAPDDAPAQRRGPRLGHAEGGGDQVAARGVGAFEITRLVDAQVP